MVSALIKSPAKRGRPSAEQAARITEAITLAARELFLARGFVDVTMEDIAAKAGVPKSTIYKRHADKVALLRFVILERIEQNDTSASLEFSALPEDLENRLKHHARNVLCSPTTRELTALASLAQGNWEGAEQVAAAVHEASYVRMIDFLEKEIDQFAGPAHPAPRDARSVAQCLMVLLAGWLAISGTTEPDSLEAMRFADRSVELLFRGRADW